MLILMQHSIVARCHTHQTALSVRVTLCWDRKQPIPARDRDSSWTGTAADSVKRADSGVAVDHRAWVSSTVTVPG